ncbi:MULTISPECIES: intermembrane transport protein PqiB [Ralstonia solanacearum species complex]|uniref:PqiB family protein n=1 Tax=Ralstonia solanacearum species complex TaxID=3116862 RepID=UPI000E57A821|nr:MlaD family protein [Ralstonia solanacearum]BEU71236.1 MlaD family protein [Ralstonia pseudosolanacearum]AXV76212.1 mammalian cell entry protein [Ralstonia solanacearum]AXV90220.1 mammalian cell entry protein [Ralstonia solanacearum]AXW18408.1 mammalian cell entry protein [Ralstonia solanacearum]AXW75130.1 mammalian cell entry protein [Ralstonia solanacearum]
MTKPSRSAVPDDGRPRRSSGVAHCQRDTVGHPAGHRLRWLRLLLWLVPLMAALVSIGLVAGQLRGHGPEIVLSFLDGEGIEPGKTPVKYNDVGIGTVTAVRLSTDLSRVFVTVQLTQESADFATKGTRFWIARPRAGMSGASGLGTLLSGTYIGADSVGSRELETQFTGLENPPVVSFRQKGARFVLRGPSLDSVETGSPVYYRHVEVGQVTGTALDKDGAGVTIDVFVEAPYHRYVGRDTQWQHASGLGLQLDAAGLRLNTESFQAMLLGGIAFQSSPGQPVGDAVPDGTVFSLQAGNSGTTESLDGKPATVVMHFDQSLRGLSVGAAVDFRGVQLGEVTNVGVEFDPKTHTFVMPVTLSLYPDRLGQAFRASSEYGDSAAGKALLRKLVAQGLRGQLRTGNLLTNQLYVALDMFPNAPPAQLDLSRTPIALPTIPNTLDDLQAQIADLAKTLDRVPLNRLGAHLGQSLDNARHLFALADAQLAPQARATLAAARQAFDAAQAVVQSPLLLPTDLSRAREQLAQTLRALDTLTDTIVQHPESLVWGKTADTRTSRSP